MKIVNADKLIKHLIASGPEINREELIEWVVDEITHNSCGHGKIVGSIKDLEKTDPAISMMFLDRKEMVILDTKSFQAQLEQYIAKKLDAPTS